MNAGQGSEREPKAVELPRQVIIKEQDGTCTPRRRKEAWARNTTGLKPNLSLAQGETVSRRARVQTFTHSNWYV